MGFTIVLLRRRGLCPKRTNILVYFSPIIKDSRVLTVIRDREQRAWGAGPQGSARIHVPRVSLADRAGPPQAGGGSVPGAWYTESGLVWRCYTESDATESRTGCVRTHFGYNAQKIRNDNNFAILQSVLNISCFKCKMSLLFTALYAMCRCKAAGKRGCERGCGCSHDSGRQRNHRGTTRGEELCGDPFKLSRSGVAF